MEMTKMKVLVYPNKTKQNIKGECPLYIRITVNKERTEFAFGYSILFTNWDKNAQKLLEKAHNSALINNAISVAIAKLLQIQNQFALADEVYSALTIKNKFLNKVEPSKTLIQLFDLHIKRSSQLISKGYSIGRIKRYKVAKGKLERFLKAQYNCSDLALNKLTLQFINDFEFYLKTKDGVSINTATGYLKILKLLVKVAITEGWLEKDPFLRFKCKQKDVVRDYLTIEEIELLMKKEFATYRMKAVRDVFVFCCYTGLSYSDVAKLNLTHLHIGYDREQWIFIDRTKTEEPCRIPLLPAAISILEEYRNCPACIVNKKLLPVCSNQKMNEYLKEMADVCGINKKISCHVARHTYATTILLNSGIPIEVTSKLLGHKKLSSTQIYAKVTDKRIADEMVKVKRAIIKN